MIAKKHPVWIITIGLVTGFLVWYFRVILLYLFFALCLSFVLDPLVDFLAKRKIRNYRIPRMVATIISFLVLFGAGALFVVILLPAINEEVHLLRSVDPAKFTNMFDTQIYYLEGFLRDNRLTEQTPGFLKATVVEKLNDFVNEENATNLLGHLLNGVTNGLIALFSVLFITFFSLKDENLLKKSLANIIPGKYYTDYISVFNRIQNLLSRYFIGLLVQASLISVIVTVALMILGIQNALLVGILVGIINVIPYLGQVISVFVALLFGIASNMDILNSSELMFLMIKIVLIVVGTQTLDSFVFQPLIFSKSVKAHPLEIFLMVFVGGTIGGPFGMFMAIPVYTVLKITYMGFYGVYMKNLKREQTTQILN
jgi:predicted PurR-regulated permease PerM